MGHPVVERAAAATPRRGTPLCSAFPIRRARTVRIYRAIPSRRGPPCCRSCASGVVDAATPRGRSAFRRRGEQRQRKPWRKQGADFWRQALPRGLQRAPSISMLTTGTSSRPTRRPACRRELEGEGLAVGFSPVWAELGGAQFSSKRIQTACAVPGTAASRGRCPRAGCSRALPPTPKCSAGGSDPISSSRYAPKRYHGAASAARDNSPTDALADISKTLWKRRRTTMSSASSDCGLHPGGADRMPLPSTMAPDRFSCPSRLTAPLLRLSRGPRDDAAPLAAPPSQGRRVRGAPATGLAAGIHSAGRGAAFRRLRAATAQWTRPTSRTPGPRP